MWIKSKEGLDYETAAKLQAPNLGSQVFVDPVKVTATLYYTSHRSDLDESVLLDALQGRVYLNDRQVKEKHIFHGIDKDRPRAEVRVELIK